jgi:hypothetical protein
MDFHADLLGELFSFWLFNTLMISLVLTVSQDWWGHHVYRLGEKSPGFYRFMQLGNGLIAVDLCLSAIISTLLTVLFVIYFPNGLW